MTKVISKRVTAQIQGDFVVFLIGMRINKPWKIHKWLPVALAMPKMIKELHQHPESGFLGHIMSTRVIVQYWRSFEHLQASCNSSILSAFPGTTTEGLVILRNQLMVFPIPWRRAPKSPAPTTISTSSDKLHRRLQ